MAQIFLTVLSIKNFCQNSSSQRKNNMKKSMIKIKNYINNINILSLIIPFIFISSLFYCLFLHFKEKRDYNEIQNNMIKIPVIYPHEKPNQPTKDIDLALALFSINIPENTIYPVYSPDLPYRGLTTGDALFPTKHVFIGDMAFTSWSILGSTLGHEIEIHCNQSFLKIEFLNFLYLIMKYPEELITKIFPSISMQKYDNLGYGSYLAEKEAYSYEVKSKRRYHLNTNEVIAIKNTLENELI